MNFLHVTNTYPPAVLILIILVLAESTLATALLDGRGPSVTTSFSPLFVTPYSGIGAVTCCPDSQMLNADMLHESSSVTFVPTTASTDLSKVSVYLQSMSSTNEKSGLSSLAMGGSKKKAASEASTSNTNQTLGFHLSPNTMSTVQSSENMQNTSNNSLMFALPTASVVTTHDLVSSIGCRKTLTTTAIVTMTQSTDSTTMSSPTISQSPPFANITATTTAYRTTVEYSTVFQHKTVTTYVNSTMNGTSISSGGVPASRTASNSTITVSVNTSNQTSSSSTSPTTTSAPSNPPTPSTGPVCPPKTAQKYRGFNIINQSPSRPGQMKDTNDWTQAFKHIQQLPGNYNAARLYSTTDGGVRHLEHALPAAKAQNISLHIGVWSGGDEHTARFEDEKAALDEALATHGCANIIAISIGNEDIYSSHRNDDAQTPLTDIALLVNQTQTVAAVLDKHSCCDVKITHTDTFGDWLNTSFTEPLVRQVDFLTVNIFPYWSGEHIDAAAGVFWAQLNRTRDMAARYGKEVWVGETGWPVAGDTVGEAVPGLENVRRYWREVGCELMGSMHAFWYVEWDGPARTGVPSFGLLDVDGKSVVGDVLCA